MGSDPAGKDGGDGLVGVRGVTVGSAVTPRFLADTQVPMWLVMLFLRSIRRALIIRCWVLGGDVDGLKSALDRQLVLLLRERRVG